MKKALLFLSCLGLAGTSFGQASISSPWQLINNTNPVQSPPNYEILHLHMVSPTVTWLLTREAVPGAINVFYMRSINGVNFDFNAIDSPVSMTGEMVQVPTCLQGINATTAIATSNDRISGGGKIKRTTDGGNTWTDVATSGQLAAPNGSANWAHMFNSNEGVVMGNPTAGQFEVLRTTDSGLTWTRIPSSSFSFTPQAGEQGVIRGYFGLGNTLWASLKTPGANSRILKSVNAGLTWTVHTLPTSAEIKRLAFTDANNGIALTATGLLKTTDGGISWAGIVPVVSSTGRFHDSDIAAVPGLFISAGGMMPGNQLTPNPGTSFSADGITWTDFGGTPSPYLTIDLLNASTGVAGSVTTGGNSTGGLYRLNQTVSGTRRDTWGTALTVHPNPSAGRFLVELAAPKTGELRLRVLDALGRVVLEREPAGPAASHFRAEIDLTARAAGFYTLELSSPQGIAQRKLVIE